MVNGLVSAYVLAKMEAGKDKDVFNEVKKLRGIKRASATYGIYDLIVEVNFERIEELDEFVFDKLRKIPGIKETVTIISSETLI